MKGYQKKIPVVTVGKVSDYWDRYVAFLFCLCYDYIVNFDVLVLRQNAKFSDNLIFRN